MIRIGFIPSISTEWIGGINYFRNLLSALVELSPEEVEPVMILADKVDMSLLSGFPQVPVIKRSLYRRYSPAWIVQKVMERYFHKDMFLASVMRQNDIQVLSHWVIPDKDFPVPTIGWIPDFQHIYLPEFFSKHEISQRNASFKQTAQYSNTVLLSSHNAKADFIELFPQYASKAKVLQFVVDYPKIDQIPSVFELEEKYGFRGKYFHIPNQFWAHKNHKIVLEALHILKQQGRAVKILATGQTKDYRQPNHYRDLLRLAADLGVSDSFQVLGIIPYSDLVGIMLHSVALINPSLFEGWSTTVEEAKTLGKRMVLSDLPVHREQNPARGVFFNPKSAEQLADILWNLQNSHNPDAEVPFIQAAKAALPERRRKFVNDYIDIVSGVT